MKKINLELLDRVVRPKIGNAIVQHHAIYMGFDISKGHIFIENNEQEGVRLLTMEELFPNGITDFTIKKFAGCHLLMQKQYKLALSLIGTKYDLIKFNCESFANLIQHNVIISHQSKKVLKFIGVLLLIVLFLVISFKLFNQTKK
jgi:hypothetical protein